jgi:hypothetical protein
LMDLGVNAQATMAFYREFEVLQNEIESLGRENFSNSQQSNIQLIVRHLGKTAADEEAEEVIDYLEKTGPYLGTTSSYARLTQAYEDLSESVYLENDDLAQAKAFAILGAQSVDAIPTDKPKTAVYYTYRAALTAAAFGENSYAEAAIAKALEIDPTEQYTGHGDSYEYYPIVMDALTDTDMNTTIANIAGMSSDTDRRYALNYGAAAALFLNGEADTLFDTYYTNTDIFSREYYVSEHVKLGPATTMPNALIIKLLGSDAQLEEYLDRMFALAQEWNITMDSYAQAVYAEWGEDLKDRESYLAMAAMYQGLNSTDKARAVISESIGKVVAFTTISQKIESLINILAATAELDLEDATQKATMLAHLYSAAMTESFDEVDEMMQAANTLAAYGKQAEAKAVADRAYSLIDDLVAGDFDNVQERAEALVGDYTSSKVNFEVSIANGYFQAGDYVTAVAMIEEAKASIDTLENTVDQYELYASVAVAYGYLNDAASAQSVINLVQTTEQYEEAIVETAKALANYDAFLNVDVATVDSDGDGKPDFFDIGATDDAIAASGLELDDDIDGDGIDDTIDTFPYDNI